MSILLFIGGVVVGGVLILALARAAFMGAVAKGLNW